MDSTDYAYAVANIRANEYKLLTAAELKRFVSAASAGNVLRELESRGYDSLAACTSEREILAVQNRRMFEYLRELAQDSDIFDIFLMKNDFHNMKTAIKGRIAGRDTSDMRISPCLLSPEIVEKCAESGSFSGLPDWINETAEKAFVAAAETNDGQLCDIILDKGYLEQMRQAAMKSKNAFMIELAEKIVSMSNLRTAIRACKYGKSKRFIENALVVCGSFDINELADAAENRESLKEFLAAKGFSGAAAMMDGSMTAFEKYCDDAILEHAQTVKYNVFGIEPLIAHLIYHEAQQKNLQIILSGKRAGVDEREILERMRKTYA